MMGGTEDQDRFLAYPDPTSALAWAASGERDIFVDQEELRGQFFHFFFSEEVEYVHKER